MFYSILATPRYLAALALLALILIAALSAPAIHAAPDTAVYLPIILGSGAATIPPAEQAVTHLNEYRALAGVPAIELDAALVTSAERHATYAILNDGDTTAWVNGPHGEVVGKPGFSGQTVGERATAAGFLDPVSGEVMDLLADPRRSVDDLMATVFHRTGLLLPWNRSAGYGSRQHGTTRVDVFDLGRRLTDPPLTPGVVVFPAPGQVDVPLVGWDEQPSAVPPGAPYPFGYSVTLQPMTGSGLVVTHAELRDDRGILVAVYPNPAACGDTCYALTPIDPLHAATTYTARAAGIVDGVAFTRTWSFTTGTCAGPLGCTATTRVSS